MLLIGSLYFPKKQRTFLLPLIWVFLGLAFCSIEVVKSLPGFSHQFGMLIIITFLCSPIILNSGAGPITVAIKPNGAYNWHLGIAYKQFNNPRMLPPKAEWVNPNSSKRKGIMTFCVRRLTKLAILHSLKAALDHLMAPTLKRCTLNDFSVAHESILRRILSSTVTAHEIRLRIFISMVWIMDSIWQLEITHFLMATIFVVFLRADGPDEWPPLFGNPLEAHSLRRFWGIFWHRLISPAAMKWGQFIAERLFFLPGKSWAKKIFIAFFVFSLSGFAHAIVGWKMGDSSLERDVFFFWTNFLGVSLEVMISKSWPRKQILALLGRLKISQGIYTSVIHTMGYLWVLGFFIWLTPRLMYPKIYQALLGELSATP
jgi:hypothetical protein